MANKAKPVNFTKSSVDINKDQTVIVSADFNGDKNVDIVTSGNYFNSNGISVLLGDGTGNFLKPIDYKFDGVAGASAGDFNNDNKVDLAVLSGGVKVLLGDGKGSFSKVISAMSNDTYPSLKFLTSDDFNHDGNLDLVAMKDVFDAKNIKTNFYATLLLGDGKGNFGKASDFIIEPTQISIPDSYTSNTVTKLDNTLSGIKTNSASPLMATGDFNGDGYTDVASSTQSFL